MERSSRRQNIKVNPKESRITLFIIKSENSHAFEVVQEEKKKKYGKGPRKLM